MLSSGLPVFLAYLVMPCALLAFNKLLQPFGDSAVSAFCIAYRLQIIFMLPSLSLGIAAGILSNRASLVHKPYYKLNAIILSVMLSVPLMFLLFLFSNKLSSFFSTSIFIQENIQLYFHYITLGYVGLLPFVTLIALWEQTGFALQGLLINGIVLFCQVLAGIIAMHEHSLNLFYVLSVSVMLVITLLTLMISFFRTRRHLLCIALTI
jgi:Na+-driven multidrug efflux pump